MRLSAFFSTKRSAAAFVSCAAALGAVAALAATASPAAPAGATAAATAPKCATSVLVVWLDTQGNGTAGSIFYNLHLTNLSGHTCTLSGYPGISAVDLGGHQLGKAASNDSSATPRTVRLSNGATATAVLRIVDAGNFSGSDCRQVTAAGLRVFPPNQTVSKGVPFPFSACSRSGPVYLSVQAVRK